MCRFCFALRSSCSIQSSSSISISLFPLSAFPVSLFPSLLLTLLLASYPPIAASSSALLSIAFPAVFGDLTASRGSSRSPPSRRGVLTAGRGVPPPLVLFSLSSEAICVAASFAADQIDPAVLDSHDQPACAFSFTSYWNAGSFSFARTELTPLSIVSPIRASWNDFITP